MTSVQLLLYLPKHNIFSKIPGGQCQGVSYFGFYFYCNFINKLFEMFAVGGGEGGGRGGGLCHSPLCASAIFNLNQLASKIFIFKTFKHIQVKIDFFCS